jgi:hypothetical protein
VDDPKQNLPANPDSAISALANDRIDLMGDSATPSCQGSYGVLNGS